MHIVNFHHRELSIPAFSAQPGQAWCWYGANGSGIERFLDLISGTLDDHVAETLELPENVGMVSFRGQQEMFEEELRNDDSDFLDRLDPGTLVRDFLPGHQQHLGLLEALAMTACLDKGYRQLSSGQTRKLLLLRELLAGRSTLVLEHPYDGLDSDSCRHLDQTLALLPVQGLLLLATISDLGDLPPWADHLAIIADGTLVDCGPCQAVLHRFRQRPRATTKNALVDARLCRPLAQEEGEELIALNQGFAGYGEHHLFSGLQLFVRSGDHTLITGPNGCGKSTLLDIISGDNSKCYANDLRLFGKRRGAGESIWEIKKEMGIVSPSLHREHRVPGSALHIVLSGLYDSIGLYHRPSATELRMARQWLQWLDLAAKVDTPFRRLSFAEQRRLLIGRALIKGPKLLLLDEPTHGLDDATRQAFLDLLERIATERLSTLLYVSHRQDEFRAFFKQHLCLETYAA
jgi:molybdate transport system ATP-binding protein